MVPEFNQPLAISIKRIPKGLSRIKHESYYQMVNDKLKYLSNGL